MPRRYARTCKMLPARSITVLLAVLSIFALFSLIWSFSDKPPPINDQQPLPPFSPFPYGITPFAPSWKVWYMPGAWSEGRGGSRYGGKVDAWWNIYDHLGGNGPWVQKLFGVVTDNPAPPDSCYVQQVHMLSRHSARYPTESVAQAMTTVIDKIKASTSSRLDDEFEFLNHWHLFIDESTPLAELTSRGPFAGHLEAFTTGAKFRTRYHHLLQDIKTNSEKLRIFAASSRRVVESARYFTQGFLGLYANDTSELVVISEDKSRGGNTLSPADTCIAFREDQKHGHGYGDSTMKKFRATYSKTIANRLKKKLSSGGRHAKLELTDEDIFALHSLCGFETTARGKSPWCDVFSIPEWDNFEYSRDLVHYYRSGPGNPYGSAMGSLWLNATGQLLAKNGLSTEPLKDPFYLSWTHDTDIIAMISALQLFRDGPQGKLPSTHLEPARNWRMSTVVPMGGRFIIEKLVCDNSDQSGKEIFVRLNINDGIVAVPGCATGPGLTCPLKSFLALLDEKLSEAQSFAKTCKIDNDSPKHIQFLYQS